LAAPDRTVKPVSHKAVQQFKGKIELLGFSQRGLRILRVLGTPDCTASDAAKVVGCSKSLVSHWKNHAIKTGCLRLLADGIVKYYELTPLGKKILERSKNLTTGEGDFGCVHVLEDHAVKFEILKEEDAERRIDWRKLGEPRNWVKWGFKLGNVRVVKTSRSIIIHPGKLRDFDADALLVLAGQIVGRVRLELMVRFGMVLSEEGVALHAPVWEVFTPEAKELENAGTFKVHMRDGAVGGLDNSPPDCKRHFEYNRKELAVAAVRSPELFVELAQKVDVLIQTVSGLVTVNERLVGLLSEAFDLAKGNVAGKEAVKFGDGGKSYVR
jgi:DNA-binding MarR family transcriptional regulator